MQDKSNVLVVVESENFPIVVVERATWLARTFGYSLDLILCEPAIGPLGHRLYPSYEENQIIQAIETVRQEMIDGLAVQPRELGIVTTTEVLQKRDIVEAILTRAEETKAQFIVKGSKYHSSAERGLFVDTDWQLMRVCPTPLWMVKTEVFDEKNPLVIAAVDPLRDHDETSKRDEHIVEMAKSITTQTDGEIHLFHSYQRLAMIGAAVLKAIDPVKLRVDEIDKKTMKEHRDALDALAESFGIATENVHQLPGRTHELLPTFARSKNADLVIMGALARWDMKHATIGSTAERVIDHLSCDVLIVR